MVKPIIANCILFMCLTVHVHAQKVVFEGLKDINGTQLYFKVIGEGDPILIVHGGPGLNHNYFLPHLEKLAKKHQLIFYDQRSAGQSQLNVKANMNLNTFAQDIEAIRVAFGIDKLNILCHSWGALPVCNYALSYPENVQSIIFCNPVPLSNIYSRQIAEIAKSRITPEDSIKRAEIMASPGFQKGELETVNALMHISFRELFCDTTKLSQLHTALPDNYMVASLSLYGLLDDMKNYNYYVQLPQLQMPVLVIHGNCDLTPVEIDSLISKTVPGSTLTIFEHSGHFPFIEENKKFIRLVRSFEKDAAKQSENKK